MSLKIFGVPKKALKGEIEEIFREEVGGHACGGTGTAFAGVRPPAVGLPARIRRWSLSDVPFLGGLSRLWYINGPLSSYLN